MITMFDVGDIIQARFKAKIVSYSITNNEDCYVLELYKPGDTEETRTRIYLSTEDLKRMYAEKLH